MNRDVPQSEPMILSGVRVLDLTLALAGPAASQRLGDLGAEIIKVEPTLGGDWSRTHPIRNAWLGEETTVFVSLNRNKRSIALNLKTQGGRAVMKRLIESSDVFLSNFRSAGLARLGLDAASVEEMNPKIIYATMTGYGEDGPDRDRPGQDLLLQAYSGLVWNTGAAGDPPRPSPIYVADVMTAHVITEGILAALLHRERTGRGQRVTTSMLHTLLDSMLQELVSFMNAGVVPTRSEEPLAHVLINPPYGFYRTADGWMAIAMADPRALAAATESADIKRIGSWEEAAEARDVIFRAVTAVTPTRTTAEWIARFDEYGIWAGPVHTYADVCQHPQVIANDMIGIVEVPGYGPARVPTNPLQFSDHVTPMQAPPRLGEHSREILREVGFEPGEIEAMLQAGVALAEESSHGR